MCNGGRSLPCHLDEGKFRGHSSKPPILTNINHVVICVSDQKATLAFNLDKLGFELRGCTLGELVFNGNDLEVAPVGRRTTLSLVRAWRRARIHGARDHED
jgi:hypothetical protein